MSQLTPLGCPRKREGCFARDWAPANVFPTRHDGSPHGLDTGFPREYDLDVHLNGTLVNIMCPRL